MKSFAALALFSAGLLPSVLGHGFVDKFSIDGKEYKGKQPWGSGASAIRRVDNTEPNHIQPASGTKNDKPENIACGRGAARRAAGVMATAKPGSKVVVSWDGGNGSQWPHNSGPVIDYMGKCDPAGCDKTDATKVQWFKINQVGKKPGQGNKWFQEDMMKAKDHTFNLPSNLPNGDYILRHEIIALHLGDKTNGAEFYPSCFNVRVAGGSSSGTPSSTVRFPGGYGLNDKGIKINIWNNAKNAYPFPGPAIASFGGAKAASKTDDPTGDDAAVTEPEPSTDDKGKGEETGSGETDSGEGAVDDHEGDDEECTEESNENSGSGSEDPTPASGATKTVTVTVTVTATPTSGSSSESKSKDKSDYKRSPLHIRRSRAHLARSS